MAQPNKIMRDYYRKKYGTGFKIVNKLPKKASYQGVNMYGDPIYYDPKTDKSYILVKGYGTPLYGKPKGDVYLVRKFGTAQEWKRKKMRDVV